MVEEITILLAEAAIEPFPNELLKNIKAKKYLAKVGKSPDEIILDVSEHGFLMKNLKKKYKRGRSDIVHLALLACHGSIIAKRKKLNVVIHTYNDVLIYINSETRIPRALERFKGLFSQLFKFKTIPPKKENPLIYSLEGTLEHFIKENREKHDIIVEFSVKGERMSLPEIAEELAKRKKPLLIFGAFQKGQIETLPESLIDKKIAIFEEGLDLFTAISHILAAIEYYEEELQKSKYF